MVRRRQVLLTTLAAGATATAGCIDDSSSDDGSESGDDQSTNSNGDGNENGNENEGGDEDSPSDLEAASDGVYRVDIDAVSDRSASINDFREITYDGDPEVVWTYEAFGSAESDESTPELAVDPVIDTTADAENLFLAPVYDADAETWTIHAYADETYYEARDTQRFWIGQFYGPTSEEWDISDRDAAFTEHHDGVYRATVEYGETPPENKHPDELRNVALVNSAWDETALEDSDSIRGAVVGPSRVGPTSPDYNEADGDDPAPVVDFSFEYDSDAKTVTIHHEGGDAFRGEHVQVGFEGGLTEEQFTGEVTVADELTVAVPSADPGEYLAVTWRGPKQEYTIVLDRFEIPE